MVLGRVVTDVNALHQKSDQVDMSNKQLVTNLRAALMGMYNSLDGKLQGLSAIQCGIALKCILLRYVKGVEPIIAYNPKVILNLGVRRSHEGCLSEGDRRWWVFRPMLSLVSYQTEDGKKHIEVLPYKKARIFCHEYDHTKGVLLQDKGVLAK